MAEKTTIARPYAKAAFELAQAAGALPRWSEMFNALVEIVSVPAGARLIDSPEITAEKRADVLVEIAGSALDEHGRNLVRLLSEQHRLDCLAEIGAEYERLRAEAESVVEVELRAAVDVDDKLQARIADALKRRLGRDVRLSCVLDEELIGGAVIRAGDTVIDDSVRGRLNELATTMTL